MYPPSFTPPSSLPEIEELARNRTCVVQLQNSGDKIKHLQVRGRRHRAIHVITVKSQEKWDSSSSEELRKIKIHLQGYQFMNLYFFILESSETAWKIERNAVDNKGDISN